MATVAEISKKLCRDYKNPSFAIKADKQPSITRVAMGAMGFDFPLYSGLPEGRIIQISGKESSGKTTAAMTMLAAYQRKYPNKVCLVVDVENAMDLDYLVEMTGADLTKIIYVRPDAMSGEQILDALEEYLNADDIGLAILDSAAALISNADYESEIDKDTGMRGSIAKALNKFFKRIVGVVATKKSILIVINQVRIVGKTRMGADILSEPCGSGLRFYSSVILRFGRRTYTLDDAVDRSDGEKADGIRLHFSVQKNKTSSMARGGGFITYRYGKGLDWMFDLLEVAIKYEFIRRPNNQRYDIVDLETGEVYKDSNGELLSFIGKAKVIKYFNENPAFQSVYLKMLNKHIAEKSNKYGSLLDERLLAEIQEEQNAIILTDGEESDNA